MHKWYEGVLDRGLIEFHLVSMGFGVELTLGPVKMIDING